MSSKIIEGEAGDALMWSYKGTEYVSALLPIPCPACGTCAVIALSGPVLAEQPDGTTHVCHPLAGGCNDGFTLLPPVVFTDMHG